MKMDMTIQRYLAIQNSIYTGPIFEHILPKTLVTAVIHQDEWRENHKNAWIIRTCKFQKDNS